MVGLSPAQRARIKRIASKHRKSHEGVGELNVVPFLDVIMNIMLFVLASLAITFTATIRSTPPAHAKGSIVKPGPITLTLMVTTQGVAIKSSGGNVAPGCESLGPGIAIPAKGLDTDGQPVLDAPALTSCVARLKRESFSDESQVRIAASNGIAYRIIVQTIDAVRQTPAGEPMFPDILFTVPR